MKNKYNEDSTVMTEKNQKSLKNLNQNYITTIFLLTTSLIGIGYLTLSANLRAVGLINGLITIYIAGIGSITGALMLGKVHYYYQCENYPDLVKRVLGNRHYILILIDLLLFIIFSITTYIYFAANLFEQVLLKYNWDIGLSTTLVKLCVAITGFVLNQFRLEKLGWLSFMGNFFSFYGAMIVMIQMYDYYKTGKPKNIEYFKFNFDFFTTFGVCFYAFTNHFQIVTILKVIKGQEQKSYLSSLLRSNYFPLFLNLTVAFAGYISFGDDTPDFILFRKPLPDSNDVAMSIAQIGLFMALLLSISLWITSLKDTFLSLLNNKKVETNNFQTSSFEQMLLNQDVVEEDDRVNWKVELLVMFLFTALSFVFSVFLNKEILGIISLISSLLCPYFIIIIPSLLYLAHKQRFNITKAKQYWIYFYIMFFCLCLILSIGVNLKNLIN